MHDKHIDQLSRTQASWSQCWKELKHENKEQGRTKHEAPRSINHKATQKKNNTGTTVLERSVA